MRRIVMLEMIKTPFLAAKGEVRDVDSETAIDLERHGVAQFVVEEEQAAATEPDPPVVEEEKPAETGEPVAEEEQSPVSNSEVTEFTRKARRSRSAE
jgi:hypothetical protein